MKNYQKFLIKTICGSIISVALIWGGTVFQVAAQTTSITPVSGTADAIAIRIVPNPKQYPIDEWYALQGFQGSPQKMMVDGYEAVRDGQTVYVAGTKVQDNYCKLDNSKTCSTNADCFTSCQGSTCFSLNLGPCVSGNQLYFNIYIITYNQGADTLTQDVFGKILSNWKFNNNVSGTGTCSYPPQVCQTAADCPANAPAPGCDANNTCISPINCALDSDCPLYSYCTSPKSQLIRDVNRLMNLNQLQEHLGTYYSTHGSYPALTSGTYLPQISVSTWPSWQQVLGTQLSFNVTDPINKMGLCTATTTATTSDAGYDSSTCWNAGTGKFYKGSGANYPVTPANFELPRNSYVMAYTTDVNGSNYQICANMETKYQFMNVEGISTNLASSNCKTTAGSISGFSGSINQAPQIMAVNLKGVAGQPFTGYIQAADPDGNPLTFSTDIYPATSSVAIAPAATQAASGGFLAMVKNWIIPQVWAKTIIGGLTFSGDCGLLQNKWLSWDDCRGPSLYKTNSSNQRKLYSARAGDAGDYSFTLTVKDSLGATVSTTTNIHITAASAPVISGGNVNYNITQNSNNPLDFNIYFTTNSFSYLTLSENSVQVAIRHSFLASAFNVIKKIVDIKTAQAQIINIGQPINIGGPVLPHACTPWSPWKLTSAQISGSNGPTYCANSGLTAALYQDTPTHYHLNIHGILDTNNNTTFAKDTDLNYTLNVTDNQGQVSTKTFTVHLKANPPQITLNCNNKAAQYQYYECAINNFNASNSATAYSLKVTSVGSTAAANIGLTVTNSDANTGKISGTLTKVGDYNVQVTATNEYDAPIIVNYQLSISNNCGDTIAYPGGPWDQGGDIRDQGGYYQTVLINGRCWMQDNLNIATTPVGNQPVGDCYNGSDTYCDAEGRLYSWNEVMGTSTLEAARGLCPSGWHVPSDKEVKNLETSLGMCSPSINTGGNNNLMPSGPVQSRLFKALGSEILALVHDLFNINSALAAFSKNMVIAPIFPPSFLINPAPSFSGSANCGTSVCCADDTNWRGDSNAVTLKAGGDSGFNAQLSGGIYNYGQDSFSLDHGVNSYFWTSSANTTSTSFMRALTLAHDKIYRGSLANDQELPLRCIKDLPCLSGCSPTSSTPVCDASTGNCVKCIPQCAGKCGGASDGCGGQCGASGTDNNCAVGTTCASEICVCNSTVWWPNQASLCGTVTQTNYCGDHRSIPGGIYSCPSATPVCDSITHQCEVCTDTTNCGHTRTVVGTLICSGYNTCGVLTPNACGCKVNCNGFSCGHSDGCGGICDCNNGKECFNYSCCIPNCDPHWDCGSDGCGGSCGGCDYGYQCKGHQCV